MNSTGAARCETVRSWQLSETITKESECSTNGSESLVVTLDCEMAGSLVEQEKPFTLRCRLLYRCSTSESIYMSPRKYKPDVVFNLRYIERADAMGLGGSSVRAVAIY